MGRKPFEPTAEEKNKVFQLAASGFTVADIALVIYRYGKPVSEKTIRKYFHRELQTARIETVSAVAGRLFKKAMSGDTASMIFYLKTRGGWRETQTVDNISSDGSMTPQAALSPEQFAEIACSVADKV